LKVITPGGDSFWVGVYVLKSITKKDFTARADIEHAILGRGSEEGPKKLKLSGT
jgi:hypothetical protein